MKFILNENLLRFNNGYVGVIKQCIESFKIGDVFGQIIQYPMHSSRGRQSVVVFNKFTEDHKEYFNAHSEINYLFRPIFCSINLCWNLPKVILPDTELEYILQEYHEKLRQYDTRKSGQQVGIPRTSRCRDYQVEGFEDGYNKAKEHFGIIDRRGIKEIELEDDVEECPGDCEQPDIWDSCNDGCINSRIVPRVIDGKVIVKNIVYDDTL